MRPSIQFEREALRVVTDEEPWPLSQRLPLYGAIAVASVGFWIGLFIVLNVIGAGTP